MGISSYNLPFQSEEISVLRLSVLIDRKIDEWKSKEDEDLLKDTPPAG